MFLRIASESNIPSKHYLNISIANLSKIIQLKNEEKKKMSKAIEKESNEPIKIFPLESKNDQINGRNIKIISPLSQSNEISEENNMEKMRNKKFIFNNIKIINKSSIKIRKRKPYNTNRANIYRYYEQIKDNEEETSKEKYDFFQKRQNRNIFSTATSKYQTPNYSRRYEDKDTNNEIKFEMINSQNEMKESNKQSGLREIISQIRTEKKAVEKFKIINMQNNDFLLERRKKLEKRTKSHNIVSFAIRQMEKRKKEEMEREEEKKRKQEEKKKIIEKMRKKLKIRRELEIKEQKKIKEIMIQKKLEKEEKRINYIKEVERKKSKRKIIELKKLKQEKLKHEREQEQLRQKKEQEQKEKELEREKRKKIREELDIIIKERIKKKEQEFLSQSLELQKQKMEARKERERELQYYAEMKRLKQQEEEDRIQEFIKQLKIKAEKEKELELKEEECDNKESKYKYSLNLLKEYIKQYLNIYESNEISEILEIINKIGKLLKKIINYEKEKKDNFISIQDAIESNNIVLKFLGVLGEEYNKNNVYSIIEKESEDTDLIDGIFKVFLSTYCILPKYEIKINSDTFKSTFSEDPKQWVQFINDIKAKISNKFNIPESKIYIISYRIDLLEFSIVILDNPFINLQRYEKSYSILVRNRSLLEYVKLSPDFFEREFNRDINDWDKNNLRKGGEKYTPPIGWKGFALKVLNKFDNSDNSWLGNEGKDGEWAIAFHGIGKGNVFPKLINIVLHNLKEGQCQLYAGLKNSRDKLNNSYIGRGVYLSPDIEEAEKYTEKIKLGERKSYFQFIIMCRVRPDKIRVSKGYPYNWILDGNFDCIRPYRILVKES